MGTGSRMYDRTECRVCEEEYDIDSDSLINCDVCGCTVHLDTDCSTVFYKENGDVENSWCANCENQFEHAVAKGG